MVNEIRTDNLAVSNIFVV